MYTTIISLLYHYYRYLLGDGSCLFRCFLSAWTWRPDRSAGWKSALSPTAGWETQPEAGWNGMGLPQLDGLPMKNGDLPMKNGDLPIKNGDLPIKNGDFP